MRPGRDADGNAPPLLMFVGRCRRSNPEADPVRRRNWHHNRLRPQAAKSLNLGTRHGDGRASNRPQVDQTRELTSLLFATPNRLDSAVLAAENPPIGSATVLATWYGVSGLVVVFDWILMLVVACRRTTAGCRVTFLCRPSGGSLWVCPFRPPRFLAEGPPPSGREFCRYSSPAGGEVGERHVTQAQRRGRTTGWRSPSRFDWAAPAPAIIGRAMTTNHRIEASARARARQVVVIAQGSRAAVTRNRTVVGGGIEPNEVYRRMLPAKILCFGDRGSPSRSDYGVRRAGGAPRRKLIGRSALAGKGPTPPPAEPAGAGRDPDQSIRQR